MIKRMLCLLLSAKLLFAPIGEAIKQQDTYNNTYQKVMQQEILEQPEDNSSIKWIDRIDWTGREYVKDLYYKLEEGLDPNGCLIDITKAESKGDKHYIYVTTLEGTANKKSEAKEQIEREANIVGQYIAVAYTAFERDHPEVFWLSGKARYNVSDYFQGESPCNYKADIYFIIKNKKFDIRSPEYQDTEKIKETIELRDKLVADITQSSPSSNRYEMLKYFNKYLIERNQYNNSSDLYSLHKDCYECISGLKGSTGPEGPVCGGYAQAFKVLCDRANIPCVLVTGYIGSTESSSYHIWNYVQMEDEKWYAVDVTWNDAVTKDEPSTAWFLIGSETKVTSKTFGESRTISNKRLNTVYEGGPELNKDAYNPNKAL